MHIIGYASIEPIELLNFIFKRLLMQIYRLIEHLIGSDVWHYMFNLGPS